MISNSCKLVLMLVVFIGVSISFQSKAYSASNPMNMFKGNFASSQGDKAYFEDKNYSAAFKEYSKAASAGSAYGQFMLANMYLEGKGVRRDRKKFIYWVSKSADKGYPSANYLMGMAAIKRNPNAAYKYFRKAARKKHGASMHMLGLMCSRGIGIKKDLNQALKWFKLAKANGSYVDDRYLSISTIKKSYKKNAFSPIVKEVQERLIKLGYNPGPADGLYGKKTRNEIIIFQNKMSMKPDGLASGKVLRSLRRSSSH